MALRREPPERLETVEFVTRVNAVSRTLLIIMVFGVLAGIAFAIFGVVLVLHGNTDATSSINIFGQTINTTSIGVACVGIGAIVAILTIRRVLGSLDLILKR